MRIAYVDCFSGLSGDMFLGALVDAGLAVAELQAAVGSLPVQGYDLSAERVTRQGISGYAVRVRLDNPSTQPHRHLADIERIIRGSTLESAVIDGACAVFRSLAEAEATVHGTSIDAVHFHEVGAVDAIVDIVGVVWGLKRLEVEQVFASSVPTGSGTVRSAHGLLPVPAPATMALLARAGAPLRPSTATSELVTPTGAALLTTLATFGQPRMTLAKVGYGFGQKVFDWPNVARLWLGDVPDVVPEPIDEARDEIIVIEANLDDEIPEVVGATMDLLFGAGALDVFFTPIQMKRNRPAVKLTVLSPVELADSLGSLIIRETSTLGVRTYSAGRIKARRWQESVATPWGIVRIKVKEFGSERRAAPEHLDCLAIARDKGVPLPEVYRAANAAAIEKGLIPSVSID
jgi:uncharacterized protein (TIGR00299 family) protein